MKLLFTGGGSGGHFYPIIAIVQEIHVLSKEKKILEPDMYFMSETPYNKGVLFDNGITYVNTPAGKLRRYFSILNFFDIFKTAYGILSSVVALFFIFPDVVIGKGGYASFPALLAARILGIPVVIHESDSVPGRVNAWAGTFAERIAVSYKEAGDYFPKDRVAWTGNPVRSEIAIPATEGVNEFLHLEDSVPVILVLGGSQGARLINDLIIDALPQLLNSYQIIHQTGGKNLEETKRVAEAVLLDHPHKDRYRPFDYLNNLAMRMSAGAADIVISRAGSTIFEIAMWGKPSIIIPISDSNGDHQRKNAFNYARSGAATVIEENNVTPEVVTSEVKRLMDNVLLRQKMSTSAKNFATPDAAHKIATVILELALEHEK